MVRNSKTRSQVPRHFKTLDAAAEFWDSHDLADYRDMTREAHFEVDIQRRVFLTALEPELAKKLVAWAQKRGVSAETLINLWLTEKLTAATQSK